MKVLQKNCQRIYKKKITSIIKNYIKIVTLVCEKTKIKGNYNNILSFLYAFCYASLLSNKQHLKPLTAHPIPTPPPQKNRSLKATMRRMETVTKTSPKKVKLRCLICHMLALFFLELNSKGLYPCSSAEKEKGIDVLCSGPPRNV